MSPAVAEAAIIVAAVGVLVGGSWLLASTLVEAFWPRIQEPNTEDVEEHW